MQTGKPVNYPLIVTLEIEEEHKVFFNALRKTHFPAHANYLEAHLTLFHHLPSREPFITETLMAFTKRVPFAISVNDVISIGNGVIFTLDSEQLLELHRNLQQQFTPWLKKQDQQALRPHITIQNKVTAFKASCLLEELKETFKPFDIKATGFSAWYYLGGPWRPAGYFPFEY